MRIEVVRAFFWEGAARPVGEVLEVTDRQARELAAMGKAKPAADEAPLASPGGPMTTESAGELISGRKTRKEKDDAGKSSAGM